MNLANGIYWLASVRNIKFEENELRKIYRELASKGVDIVNVISYKCIRDPGGAPDIEYALFSPSSVLPVADEAKDIDLLKLQVEIAHEEGLLTRTYLNAHWYGDGFYSKHRDWAQVKADGKPVDNLYGHGYSMCVNTGYRDRMISLAVEVASREVDIIFFDGPAYYPGACYCESCLKKFREIYGEDIPRKEDWESPSWRRFIRFRYESLRDFLVDVRRALRNRGLKTLIYSNTSGQTWPVWQFALSMEHLWEGEDILAAECYQYYTRTREVPVWLYGWTAKYGYSVKKTKPFCLFLSNAHAPWVYYRIPVTERRLASFQGIACGANILEYHDFLQELVDLTKKWSKYFKGIKSAANVALVWSRNSADYIYDEPQPPTGEVSFEAQAVQVGAEKAPATVKEESLKRFVEEARGFYEMLLRLHVPFDVISDINLNKEDLKKYDVLVLPSTVCLSNSQAEAIKEFVSEGGGLIASYEVGLRNEYGDLRENSILSEVIGARFEKLVYGPFQWDYIKLRKHPITEKVLEIIPSPKYCTLVSPTRAEVVAVHMEKLKSRYQKPVRETDIPAILVSEYSRGRVVYFTGNFGGQYWNYGFLDYIKLFKNALNWVNLKEYPLELKGPEFIEATLWRGENWYLIFLANYNYSIRRPFEEVIEAKDIKVRVKAEEPKRVLSLVYLTEYEYRVEQDRILVHVPGIKDYDIILVEY